MHGFINPQSPPMEQPYSENDLQVPHQAANIFGSFVNDPTTTSRALATNLAASMLCEQQSITSVGGSEYDSTFAHYTGHNLDIGAHSVGLPLPIPSFTHQQPSNFPPFNLSVPLEEAHTGKYNNSTPEADNLRTGGISHARNTEFSSTSSLVWNAPLMPSRPLLSHRSSSDSSNNIGWVNVTPSRSGMSREIDGSTESPESEASDTAIMSPAGSPSVQPSTASKVLEIPPLGNSGPLQYLAPKNDGFSTSRKSQTYAQCVASESPPATALSRGKSKRRPFQDSGRRKETGITRQLNACLRCRMQRNRCKLDVKNPKGPCISCQGVTTRMTRLPCLRYKITDSVLFRTGLDYMPFYKSHPMTGPSYGDFHIAKDWAGATTRSLSITQDRSSVVLTLEVREFHPPYDENARDLKGRSMYSIPWAIVDPDVAVETINTYIDNSIASYLDAILDDTDSLVMNVFHIAFRLSIFPTPNRLLRDALRLWVVCRFIESRWRCCGDDTLKAENLEDPFHPWISPPPYIDYQVASIFIERILGPLRRNTLNALQTLVLSNKPSNWYPIFLTSFILLHNYGLQVLFQRQFASRRQANVRYLDMPLVRATHSGAKTILAHFHYCCKGQQPFRPDFDWAKPQIRRMAQLDSEQIIFMEKLKERVNQNASFLRAISHTDRYEDTYWFTSQLFDIDWSPRDTHEYSPAA